MNDIQDINQTDELSSVEDDAIATLLIALCQYAAVNAVMLYFIYWLLKPLFK